MPQRILLVEDSRTAARVLLHMLSGDDVTEARRGAEYSCVHVDSLAGARAAITEHGPFDAIVLDLTLPDSAGLDTYRGVRAAAPDTAVLVLSGSDDADLARAAVDLGAQDYVRKSGLEAATLVRAIDYGIVRQSSRAEVARALRAADEANARLQEWVAHASLELLTPIATVQALSSSLALAWPELDDDHRRAQVGRIAGATRRLARTGAHFLHTTAADAGSPQPNPTDVAVADLVHGLVDDLQFATAEIDLDRTERVRADAIHVETILSNLLRNAVRHGDAPVLVDDRRVGDRVLVAISDHGPGIPEADRERVFRRYERGADTRRGSGLGLFVARRLAMANGGDVHLDPTWVHGARFVLTLPAADPVGAVGDVAA